jgi:predicted TIM-barrel fold metal-dependent hydrolase
MLIDAHIHLWDKINGKLGKQPVKPVGNGVIKIGGKNYQGMPSWFLDCRNTAELALAALDDAGVFGAVVTQEYLDGSQNNYLLNVQKKYPKRFFVHGLLDFRKPDNLKKEFETLRQKGFKGIKCPAMFLPKMNIRLDSPELMHIWQEMESHGMILSIDMAPGSLQVGQMKNIIRCFGALRICIGHFGMVGCKEWMKQICLAEFKNVYIESGGIIWLFRQEGTPFRKAQAAIRQALEAVGHKKLMWGSDYPRTMVDFTYRQSLDFVRYGCNFMSKKEKQAFLGGNAAKVYGFVSHKVKYTPHLLITEL